MHAIFCTILADSVISPIYKAGFPPYTLDDANCASAGTIVPSNIIQQSPITTRGPIIQSLPIFTYDPIFIAWIMVPRSTKTWLPTSMGMWRTWLCCFLNGGLMITPSFKMTYRPMNILAKSARNIIFCCRMAWSYISILSELLMRHFLLIKFLDFVLK